MTTEEKNKIINLRNQGYSYNEISKTMNISLGTVKSIISRNKDELSLCLYCGKPLLQEEHKKKRKFCSVECKTKWWNENRLLKSSKSKHEIICPCCNKTFFDYPNRHRVYCSNGCYKKVRYGK